MIQIAKLSALAFAALFVLAGTAQAAKPEVVSLTNVACSSSDLTGVSFSDCSGFFSGNLLKGDTGDTVSSLVAAQLSALGMANAASAIYIEKIGSLGGGLVIDFNTPLAGDTIIGLHLGQGSTRFGSGFTGSGGGTAFYRFEAGTRLDQLGLGSTLTASSGVAVFQTSAVPEPETYALMLAGLVGIGFLARRRQG
jgi:hypothetical protein